MTWDELVEYLALTLYEVRERTFLIISSSRERGGYVQFAGETDRVDAEAASARFAPGIDESRLAAAGWDAPRPEAQDLHWSLTLPLPATLPQHREFAGRCVAALRDAHGVASPEDLVYQAWRDPEPMPDGVDLQDEELAELDPGKPRLVLPELGLREEGR
ncbi:TY-Chap domain-containing protein [Brachybacterium hainanense]|uniref:TY-Chap N-terminal domain-containing protein n=1 Tax=Brachybacterium hainanense TaxID=1541174 RepID=A0ABV6RD58_9MICO